MPADRVVVTGAQCFDQWFDRQPTGRATTSAAARACRTTRPFILYVCSALFRGSPSEAAFVREWVARHPGSRRSASARMTILVRPHPQRMDEWRDPPRVVWRRPHSGGRIRSTRRAGPTTSTRCTTRRPSSASTRARSSRRPSSIGRCSRYCCREFRDNQEGTFHFHYLLTVGDGFLNASRSLEEHVGQLTGAVARGGAAVAEPSLRRALRPAAGPAVRRRRCLSTQSSGWRPAASCRSEASAAWVLRCCARSCTLLCWPDAYHSSSASTGIQRSCCQQTTERHPDALARRERAHPALAGLGRLPRHRRGGAVARRQPRSRARLHRRDRRRRRRCRQVPDAHRRAPRARRRSRGA